MKKILILFSILFGLMSSLYAVDEERESSPVLIGQWGEEDYSSSVVDAEVQVFGIKPDNPTSLVASGLRNKELIIGVVCAIGADCRSVKVQSTAVG